MGNRRDFGQRRGGWCHDAIQFFTSHQLAAAAADYMERRAALLIDRLGREDEGAATATEAVELMQAAGLVPPRTSPIAFLYGKLHMHLSGVATERDGSDDMERDRYVVESRIHAGHAIDAFRHVLAHPKGMSRRDILRVHSAIASNLFTVVRYERERSDIAGAMATMRECASLARAAYELDRTMATMTFAHYHALVAYGTVPVILNLPVSPAEIAFLSTLASEALEIVTSATFESDSVAALTRARARVLCALTQAHGADTLGSVRALLDVVEATDRPRLAIAFDEATWALANVITNLPASADMWPMAAVAVRSLLDSGNRIRNAKLWSSTGVLLSTFAASCADAAGDAAAAAAVRAQATTFMTAHGV